MKRLFFSIFLAVTVHALAFCIDWQRPDRSLPSPEPLPIVISLNRQAPAKKIAPPVAIVSEQKKTPPAVTKSVKKKSVKPAPKIKPAPEPKKKSAVKTTPIPRPAVPKESPVPEKNLTAIPPDAPPLAPPRTDQPAAVESADRIAPPDDRPTPVIEDSGPVALPVPAAPVALTEAVPLYSKNPKPRYPRLATKRGYQGSVMLEVLVTREGRAGEIRIFQTSGHGILDRAAVSAVRKWLFEPGKKGDMPVGMWMRLPIRFEIEK